ncbi:PTS system, IIA component [Psychromonas sp. CNPT3]|uniref:PTS sugar transporter subunit IIA n=1 Tax=Psychromonas sp. CNPT3 TaxID=314282 RepID=UPI00006E709D|nr:PTS sugar transporter subunit IIA [Psychromonas sp. CNPT3]AGH80138.1 PTS system, IIA component [Psychromonas sp. CNPT3]
MQKHILFLIQKPALEMSEISALKRGANYFKSLIQIHNVRRGTYANCKNALQVMSLIWRAGDLCQIKIEGLDAELSCMVFTDLINDHFKMLYTNHRYIAHDFTRPYQQQLSQPFSFHFHQQSIDPATQYNKNKILLSLTRIISKSSYKPLLSALLAREKISATGIGKRIAMPHILSDLVDEPWVVVLHSEEDIDWHSPLGDINLVLALIIPRNASKDIFRSVISLSRALLDPNFTDLLLQTRDPQELETLLLYCFKR